MTTKEQKKEQAIERIVSGLKCSREEAEEVYRYDVAVDHDEKTEHDLPPEKLAIARKQAHTGTRKTPTTYKWGTRQRKPNATKGGLIEELSEFLKEHSSFETKDVEVTNIERQIKFAIGSDVFELTLVQKRKPKK